MDDAKTRNQIQQHADAVVRGDTDAVVADFSEALRQPVTSAEVLSVQSGETERGDDPSFG